MENYFLSEFLLLIGFVITIAAQIYVNSSYKKYRKVSNEKGLSGFEVAKTILESKGFADVYVTEVKGNLSDHYDPSRKVVRLSTDIFHGTTIASASVAAHEVKYFNVLHCTVHLYSVTLPLPALLQYAFFQTVVDRL